MTAPVDANLLPPPARPGPRRVRWWALTGVVAAALGGVVAGQFAIVPSAGLIIAGVGAIGAVVLWRHPAGGLVALLVGCVTVEQFPYSVDGHDGALTQQLPLFRSVNRGVGVTALELALLVIAAAVLLRRPTLNESSPSTASRSRLGRPFALMVVVVLVAGLGHAVLGGADLKFAFWELRPWCYLALTYLLCARLFRGRNLASVILWVVVLGSGFKAIQGVVIFWSVRDAQPRPEAILSHEESFFFALFLVTTLALWLTGRRGRLRTVATVLSPVVVIALLGNSRRVAFLLLGAGVMVTLAIVSVTLAGRRRVARYAIVLAIVAAAIYLPLFWNHGGALGQPARAVQSMVSPDARDLESNRYRYLESLNLLANIRQSHSLGRGFGVPIDYSIPIVDISDVDSAIAFIPHNGILYVWMRLGIAGEFLLWSLVAAIVLAGCALARRGSPEMVLLGSVVVATAVNYVLFGYSDLGFFWFRIAVFTGFVAGAAEAAWSAPRG